MKIGTTLEVDREGYSPTGTDRLRVKIAGTQNDGKTAMIHIRDERTYTIHSFLLLVSESSGPSHTWHVDMGKSGNYAFTEGDGFAADMTAVEVALKAWHQHRVI